MRPLRDVASQQEQLYVASRIASSVADCLIDYASCEVTIDVFELLELAGRLDLVVSTIRLVNGCSG